MKKETRRFPTADELLSWWLYWRLDGLSDNDFTPPFIYREIRSFQENGCQSIHRKMYEEYPDFQKEFLPHDYVTPECEVRSNIEEVENKIAAKRRRHNHPPKKGWIIVDPAPTKKMKVTDHYYCGDPTKDWSGNDWVGDKFAAHVFPSKREADIVVGAIKIENQEYWGEDSIGVRVVAFNGK